MQKLDPITIQGLHRGMAREEVLGDRLMPNEMMRHIENMDNDAMGNLTRRLGYARVGSAQVVAGNSILGMIDHKGTNNQLVVFVDEATDTNAESYYLSGSTWTNKALAWTKSLKVRAVSFIDYIFATNGTNFESWTGAVGDAWGATNLTSAPSGSLIEVFQDQIYIGNTSTDLISWSSIPSGSPLAITWPAANNFYLNPNDGSNLAALKRYGQNLLMFKDNYLYRYNGSATDPDAIIPYGTPSQEAVVNAASSCYFYDSNRSAICAYSGGYPSILSKPVRPFLLAIPTSNHTSVTLRATVDDDHIEAFIGNVTVGGVAFVNVSLLFTISTQTWCVRTYANSFKTFGTYDDGTNLHSLGGTSEGSIVKMESGNTDLSTDISYAIETKWYVPTGVPAFRNKMASFAMFCDKYGDLNVSYKTDQNQSWTYIGNAKTYSTEWSGINEDFNRIKFRFEGTSNTDPVVFEGFSILVPILEGFEKQDTDYGLS